MRTRTVLIVAFFMASGCSGRLDYTRPQPRTYAPNTVTIDLSKDALWAKMIPALDKQFFMINNLDKASGLINISYSGDPERYVDCGIITSQVSNARGERTYNIPAARQSAEYEIMRDGHLFFVRRQVSLEGRMNLIVEEIAPRQSSISANTRYALTRQQTIRDINNRSQTGSENISFNTGGVALIGRNSQCLPTGELEKAVLELITNAAK